MVFFKFEMFHIINASILTLLAVSYICYDYYKLYFDSLKALPADHALVQEAKKFAKKNNIQKKFYLIPSKNVDSGSVRSTPFAQYIYLSKVYLSTSQVLNVIKNSTSINFKTDQGEIIIRCDNNKIEKLYDYIPQLTNIVNDMITCQNFIIGHELSHAKEPFYINLLSRIFKRIAHKCEYDADLLSAKSYSEQALKCFDAEIKLYKILEDVNGVKMDVDHFSHPSFAKRKLNLLAHIKD